MDTKNSGLCFDEKLFFNVSVFKSFKLYKLGLLPITCFIILQKDFSVDEFLAEHRRIANLETLRDDLGLFLKKLRSSTIKLINKDYADFVELSSNLIALDQDIMCIEDPLNKIKKEIMVSREFADHLSEI